MLDGERTDDLEEGVQDAPDDEIIACTVPKSADEEDNKHVEVTANGTHAATAKREVDIVTKPAGKR